MCLAGVQYEGSALITRLRVMNCEVKIFIKASVPGLNLTILRLSLFGLKVFVGTASLRECVKVHLLGELQRLPGTAS